MPSSPRTARALSLGAALLVLAPAAGAQPYQAVFDPSYGTLTSFTRTSDGFDPILRDVWTITGGGASVTVDPVGAGVSGNPLVLGTIGAKAIPPGPDVARSTAFDGADRAFGVDVWGLQRFLMMGAVAQTQVYVRNWRETATSYTLTRTLYFDLPGTPSYSWVLNTGLLRPGHADGWRMNVVLGDVGLTPTQLANGTRNQYSEITVLATFGDPTGSQFVQVGTQGFVPEPGTWALLATGLVGVAGAARFRRRG